MAWLVLQSIIAHNAMPVHWFYVDFAYVPVGPWLGPWLCVARHGADVGGGPGGPAARIARRVAAL